MIKDQLCRYRRGSAPYVVMHAAWQRSRGRGPSEQYEGEKNPAKALENALRRWNRQAQDEQYASGHRTIKRVPLDFDWPMNQVWEGYLMPGEFHFPTCPDCNASGHESGAGYNPQTAAIARNFYAFDRHPLAGAPFWSGGPGFWCPICDENVPQLSPDHHSGFCTECQMEMVLLPEGDPRLGRIPQPRWCDQITQDEVQALVDAGRLMDFTHTCTRGEGWKVKNPPYTPTAEEVNEWERGRGFGHDAINRFILIEARAKRLGVWGYCKTCNGHGDLATNKQRKQSEEWVGTEPVHGNGWQLWEVCSEGSPQSPVFGTAEDLADWCVYNATLFADDRADRATWLRLIKGVEDLGMGSLLIASPEYFGPAANMPMEAEVS